MATELLERLAASRGRTIDEALGWLEDAFARSAPTVAEPGRDVTAGDLRTLAELGADLTPLRPAEADAAADSTTTYLALLAEGLHVTEAAELLGVTPSRVRQLLAERRLYGIRPGARAWVLPRWQFTDDRVVPGLDKVLPAIPTDAHPLAVTSFMLGPHPELADQSPWAWLLGGGSAEAVLNLVGLFDLP
ncbi:MAG TPA: hypothetical protein VNQ73_03985 [Ilumatobacter sp.]|nr:hypothetical protein [Ilumatobacter sp.]